MVYDIMLTTILSITIIIGKNDAPNNIALIGDLKYIINCIDYAMRKPHIIVTGE